MLSLCEPNLPRIARRLAVPSYDRAALRPSIVHIGVGGFHRAHQAVYLDELARAGHAGWGEIGVSLRTRTVRDALAEQNGLYSVVERGLEGNGVHIVGSIAKVLFGPTDPRAVVEQLASEQTRVVTLTVTGDGYGTAEQAPQAADAPPQSWTDYLVAALAQRRAAGAGGLTVLSCDNLAHGGAAARTALLARASDHDATLARWIDHHVSFPESMVDRITPGTDDDLRALMTSRYGIGDVTPVGTEPFRQWVIEDAFCGDRPPLDDVGVQLVADVAPYKLIKSRLLNGTHTAMAYLGRLAGHHTTADVVEDPAMYAFLSAAMRREIGPYLPSVSSMGVDEYIDTVLERLANRNVADPLDRLCRRGSTKVPAYLLPALAEATAGGRRAPLLCLALAGWLRYLQGTDLAGDPIEVHDARYEELRPIAMRIRTNPHALAALRGVLGPSAADDPRVRQQVRVALRDLDRGVPTAVSRQLARSASQSTHSTWPHRAFDWDRDLTS